MNMPMFSAENSLYRSGSYRTAGSGDLSARSSSVRPQALRGSASFGGIGYRPPHWDCNIYGDCCRRTGSGYECCYGPPYNECIQY